MQKSVSDSCGQSSVDVVTDMMNTVFEQMNSIMTCQEHGMGYVCLKKNEKNAHTPKQTLLV